MSTFKIHKVVSSLPDPLIANAIYLVRVGVGFDLYVTDDTGLIAHKINNKETWINLVTYPSTPVGVSTVSGQTGKVRAHTKNGLTVYRFIPDISNPTLDSFYNNFDGTTLSNLLVSRG